MNMEICTTLPHWLFSVKATFFGPHMWRQTGTVQLNTHPLLTHSPTQYKKKKKARFFFEASATPKHPAKK